ncbi:MAG: CBS domain-containing protein [Methanobacteriaceae archaeon]|nr:CBS domain-containing protein [Methanobacteriaceae archaeon]
MRSSLKLLTVFGIPIELHISFLFLILFIYIMAFFNIIQIQVAVLITLLFVTVVIHELSHSYVAQNYGVSIERIVLLPIGGVSQMEEIPKNPVQELWISIAGPITNFVIAGIFYIVLISIQGLISPVYSSFIYDFILVNVVLGGFNMLPAFPMDGGRILRSILAKRMNFIRATELSATIGKQLAIIMGIVGLLILFNPFLVLVALFVYIGADQEYKSTVISTLLEDVYVEEIMTKEVKSFNPSTTIDDALKTMYQERHMGYPVLDDGKLVGIVTFHDISQIPDTNRHIKVNEIMTKKVITSSPQEGVVDTLNKLNINNIGRVPVMKDEKLVGIISKTDIMKILEILSHKKSE